MKELALLFLRLGSVAFGGPAAHIAMMEEEVVRRRGWLTHEEFLDLLGATNLIPGPNSTEMAIHIGYRRKGWKGLVVAGACFILPAVVVTMIIAILYVRYGATPAFGPWLRGIRPAVIALVAVAVYRLARPLGKMSLLIGAVAAAANLAGGDEILLLILAGAAGLLWTNRTRFGLTPGAAMALTALPGVPDAAASSAATIPALGIFFLKIGSILYGSGYVLIAFLRGGLVETRHWLTQAQLLDAVAAGQCTPGPVLSTATMIGYIILGVPGAAVATAGIFLPSFVWVAATSPLIPKVRKSKIAAGFLDGVNAGALGLMVSVTILLARSAVAGPFEIVVFALSAAALLWRRIHPAWILAASALAGRLFI